MKHCKTLKKYHSVLPFYPLRSARGVIWACFFGEDGCHFYQPRSSMVLGSTPTDNDFFTSDTSPKIPDNIKYSRIYPRMVTDIRIFKYNNEFITCNFKLWIECFTKVPEPTTIFTWVNGTESCTKILK